MVDSVKVYTKLKELFNWPDDSDDSPDSTMTKAPASASNVSSAETAAEGVTNAAVAAPAPLTSMDRYAVIFLSASRSCSGLELIVPRYSPLGCDEMYTCPICMAQSTSPYI